MELKVLEKSKNKIIIQVKGESHTLCSTLKEELYRDENIKSAGYYIDHPEVGVPTLVVEAKTGTDVSDALQKACTRIKKANTNFLKAFEKEIK
ncbi:MAG: RpoL/Rpb11 RNA polymerase subunit family protein [Nanoarchaeota archaeon]